MESFTFLTKKPDNWKQKNLEILNMEGTEKNEIIEGSQSPESVKM